MKVYFSTLTVLLFSACATPKQVQGPEPKKQAISTVSNFEQSKLEYYDAFSDVDLVRLNKLDVMPTMAISTLSGDSILIGKKAKSQHLVFFFTTWCPACKTALHDIDSLYRKGKFEIPVVAIGREHSVEELKKWKKDQNISIPIAADPKRAIYDKFATKYVPRLYIAQPNGAMDFQDVGWSKTVLEMTLLSLNK